MSEHEKNLHTKAIEDILLASKKDAGLLAAFEACGCVIAELKAQLIGKDMRIEELENQLAKTRGDFVNELEKRLAEALKQCS